MGRKYNRLAAQLRIIQRGVSQSGAGCGLQDASIALHTFNCELVGYNIHYASHAAALARPFIGDRDYQRARSTHRDAALQRHEVFSHSKSATADAFQRPDVSKRETDVGSRSWPPIPASAVECAALEASLQQLSQWNVNAAPFVPFCGKPRTLDLAQSCANNGFPLCPVVDPQTFSGSLAALGEVHRDTNSILGPCLPSLPNTALCYDIASEADAFSVSPFGDFDQVALNSSPTTVSLFPWILIMLI